jgi:hypothetical protein
MPLSRYRGCGRNTWRPSHAPAGRAGHAARDRPAGRGGLEDRWQRTQASLGRTWRMTLKCAGTYSSCSETSWPIWRSRPPQALQPQGWPCRVVVVVGGSGRCTCDSRGRCAGRLRSMLVGACSLRYRPAHWLLRHRFHPVVRLRSGLADLWSAKLLAGAAELGANAAQQLQLELVDHQLEQHHLAVARLDHRRSSAFDGVGLLGWACRHSSTVPMSGPAPSGAPSRVHTVRPLQAASSGRCVRTGMRQSMPSSSIDNCAGVSDTLPESPAARRSARAPGAWPAASGPGRRTTAP